MFKALNRFSSNAGYILIFVVLIMALSWRLWPLFLGTALAVASLWAFRRSKLKYFFVLIVFISALIIQIWWVRKDSTKNRHANRRTDNVATTSPSVTKTVAPVGSLRDSESVTVIRVVDGDTIIVKLSSGEKKRVRLIGIDAPESKAPGKPVECMSFEATSRLAELIEGGEVTLVGDKTQADIDKYGRLLRYVFLPNGDNVNEIMVREGLAREYTYDKPYKYQQEFKRAEQWAKEKGMGLWGVDACPSPTPVISEKGSESADATGKDEICACDANLFNCSDFGSQKEAQQCFDYCGGIENDVHVLDVNRNSIACDDYFKK